uniref:ATP-binding protein n=1 Tax=Segatella copri TaxID=165179 RepID=UPI003FF09095
MRYLNKIIFLNSAHIPYAEVKLDGNVHFIGTQGVGKSTLLRALLFFYNADKLRLGIPKEKKSFDAFYFPCPNSYIVYEVMRENGAYCVLALKNQGRVMFRFIDAPFDSKWFIDERKLVYGEWSQIREQVGKKHDISSLVSSYEMYRDIIFGNNRRQELLSFRKYAIVESAKYQNIPRTIQNVFLNTKLDADFIKDTIIRSMSDEDNSIDLNFYREQIKEFEQEYTDVSLWTKKEKNGEVLIRRIADKVIDAYRTLLNNRRLIGEGRRELNYAEHMAQELLPQYRLDIQESEAECNRVSRLIGEEQEKYGKERDKLSRELGVFDAQLKKTAAKRKHYEEIHIEDILQRVEQETIIEDERRRQEAMKAELEKSYQNVVDKYKALLEQLDMDLRAFRNSKTTLLNKHQAALMTQKEVLMQEWRKAETETREVFQKKISAVDEMMAQLVHEETALKIQKAKVAHENPFAREMETNEQEFAEFTARQFQVETEIKEVELRIETLRQEAEKELEIAELKYQASLDEPKKQKADVEAEIRKIQNLLEKSKGSFSEWLDQNRKGWQENIGKVVDEEEILYNNVLNPQLAADSLSSSSLSLYGVSINLAAVERKFRTPKELKEQLAEKEQLRADIIKLLNDLQNQHEEDNKTLKGKYLLQIRKLNESLYAKKAEMQLLPQTEKKLKMQLLESKNRLAKWRNQQLSELEDKQNALIADKVKKEELKRQLEADLLRKLKVHQAEYNRQVKTETQKYEVFVQDIRTQIEEKQKQVDASRKKLLKAQHDELHGKGMDTQALDAYNKRIAELDAELAFVRKNRDVVAVYRNDKIELFDQEPAVRQERKNKAEALMMIEDKFRQRSERLKLQLSVTQEKLTKQQAALRKLEAGLNAVKNFRSDATLCPLGSSEIGEKITTKDCLAIVEELKRQIYEDSRTLDNFKKQSQDFLGKFSAHNTFHFNVSPVTEEEFIAFASNLCEFVDNDKISEYQKRISERYTGIIFRISKEVGDLTRREGDIGKTINDINRDFEERNFAGVIREIALRPLKSNDQLMILLLRIRDFAEENQFNMGEMDLFTTESRQDVNAKAVKYLLAFMKGLLDEPNRKQLQVADTFKLEFRIKENDNDTGWVEKIANVGSDGTDILVKAMVNIMLINVFKEKASKKSGDFKIHCMMDEIGKLHPNNVKGILEFANRRNILLVNSSPTTYNVEDYKYTYLLSKDNRANTKVTQLIKRL